MVNVYCKSSNVFAFHYFIGYGEDVSKVQTLLFSATMPEWVKNVSLYDTAPTKVSFLKRLRLFSASINWLIFQIASRFFKATKDTVDLVGDEKMKASSSVRHLLLRCMRSARSQVIPDIITCYSKYVMFIGSSYFL
jgi:ATP-dependent RNA helicase DDX21